MVITLDFVLEKTFKSALNFPIENLNTILIRFSTQAANLLLVIQERAFIGEGGAY